MNMLCFNFSTIFSSYYDNIVDIYLCNALAVYTLVCVLISGLLRMLITTN